MAILGNGTVLYPKMACCSSQPMANGSRDCTTGIVSNMVLGNLDVISSHAVDSITPSAGRAKGAPR